MAELTVTLVYDRTADDVLAVIEAEKNLSDSAVLQEYISGMKGYYCHLDLNRVETAVGELVTQLNAIHTTLEAEGDISILGLADWLSQGTLSFTIKTDWTKNQAFEYSDIQRYLSNVTELRNLVYTLRPEISPILPLSMRKLDFNGANQIEYCLEQILNLIPIIIEENLQKLEMMPNHMILCGEAECGGY